MAKRTAKDFPDGMLVRVVGPRFVAALIVDPATERVVFTAPLLHYMMGQTRESLRRTFARLGWQATIVPRGTRPKEEDRLLQRQRTN